MQDDAISAVQEIARELGEWQDNLFTHSIWYTLIVAVIVTIIAIVVLTIVKRVYRRRQQGNLKFFYRLLNLIVIFISVLIVMMTITPLAQFSRTLLAGSGLLAVVIGIAAQAALGNVFSGISIGLSRPFVIGETIEVIGRDISGVVTEIGLRQTVIRDFNNKRIVVPNSIIDKEIVRTVQQSEQSVINYLTVGIGYGSDVILAIRIIKEAVMAHKDYYDTRSPADMQNGVAKDVAVAVMDLGQSSIQLRASVWSKDAGTGFMMLSDLRLTILQAFRQQNVEIPYAYQNVIIKDEDAPSK